MRSRILTVGAMAASTILASVTLIGNPASVVNAATTTVNIPNPGISSFDPTQWGGQILVDQGTVLQGLYGYNTKNQVIPEIAKSYKRTDGGKVWTFYLRHNARWSNGAPVTAGDFYFAWMRVLSPSDSTGALWASVVNYVKNGYAYHAGAVPASAVGIKVVNEYAIQLTLTGPYNPIGDLALTGSMPVYPPDVKANPTTWWMPAHFVGDGPYLVSKFVPNGTITLTRNRKYVGPPGSVGNVQRINLIPTPTVAVEDFEAHKLSVAMVASASDFKYAQTHLKKDLHEAPQANLNLLEWDDSPSPSPLYNPMVRRAIAMAINRAPIANPVLSGMVKPTNVFAYPGWPTYKLEHGIGFNVNAARHLLAKAGYPHGKGMPPIYLYVEPLSVSPQLVPVAEAVAQELKQGLGLRSQIVTVNSTIYGDIVWNGINANIHPGYVIGDGVANFRDVASLPLQANQHVGFDGVYGPQSFVAYAARNWFLPQYDPVDVKAMGNPTNTALGVSYASWKPIIAIAKKDIAYLSAWAARQPQPYRSQVQAGGMTLAQYQTELHNYLASYKKATTPATKHAAWEAFWKWVGTYSTGNAGDSMGLSALVYFYQHEPPFVHQWQMWSSELTNTASATKATHIAATLSNAIMQSGYVEPLYYTQAIYLAAPNITGVQPNPLSWGNFYQLQYLHLK